MKHAKLFIALIAICAVMVSCNKEGHYNPKKKISTISYSNYAKEEYWDGSRWVLLNESLTPRYVGQVWTWNGNLLESIEYRNPEGGSNGIDHFIYDGHRLASITDDSGRSRKNFVYKSGKLSSIEYYTENTLDAVYNIIHTGNKITGIKYTAFTGKAAEARPLPSYVLGLDLPTQLGVTDKSTRSASFEYFFEWEGDNVTHFSCVDQGFVEHQYLTYDKKLNPFRGIWDEFAVSLNSSYCGQAIMSSKNNIIHCKLVQGGDSYEFEHSYSYKGKYPVEDVWTNVSEYYRDDDDLPGDGPYRYTVVVTKNYEYSE